MKIKIQITHWMTGTVLFAFEKENNTLYQTLKEALKSGANLRGADLYGANLRGADLRGANLYGADLRGADLRGADLYGANLRGAKLRGANLYGADLRGADLYGADLYGANLRGADLYGANLRGADLRGANLYGANLYGANGIDYWWHVHHEVLVECLTEPIKNRINYIKIDKPEHEVSLRLRLLKPVLGDIQNTKKGWERLHKKECGCGWDGKSIFTEKSKTFDMPKLTKKNLNI